MLSAHPRDMYNICGRKPEIIPKNLKSPAFTSNPNLCVLDEEPVRAHLTYTLFEITIPQGLNGQRVGAIVQYRLNVGTVARRIWVRTDYFWKAFRPDGRVKSVQIFCCADPLCRPPEPCKPEKSGFAPENFCFRTTKVAKLIRGLL